jgi:hypothetical protein
VKKVGIEPKAWWPIYKLEEIPDPDKATDYIEVPNELVWRWDKLMHDFERMQNDLKAAVLKYAVGKKLHEWKKVR